jgi:hypothetical protein
MNLECKTRALMLPNPHNAWFNARNCQLFMVSRIQHEPLIANPTQYDPMIHRHIGVAPQPIWPQSKILVSWHKWNNDRIVKRIQPPMQFFWFRD